MGNWRIQFIQSIYTYLLTNSQCSGVMYNWQVKWISYNFIIFLRDFTGVL